MDFKTLAALKPKFVAREVGDELILVPLADNVAQMSEVFTLNETGRFIWENCTVDASEDEMVQLMTETFDIDTATAANDLAAFLKSLEVLSNKTA